MEIRYQSSTLTSDIEKSLLHAFNTIPLCEFVKSTELVDGLRGFFERGTPTDCWKLVPPAHKDTILKIQSKAKLNDASDLLGTTSTEDIPSTISPPASAATIQHNPSRTSQSAKEWHNLSPDCMAQSQPSSDKLLSTPSISLAGHLATQTKSNDPKRIGRLVQAIEALKSTARLPPRSYETLWSAKDGLFDGTESGHRGWLYRLQRGRNTIKTSRETVKCASRLSLMLVLQFVDYREKWIDLPLLGKPGVSRRNLACEAVAQDWGIPLSNLREDIHNSGNYFYLLQKAGPGIHLELGSKVTTLWERSLTQSDVDAILEYIKDKLPKLETRHKELNGIAARAIHAGLVACGWDSEALSKSTRLTNSIKLYIDEPNPPETSIGDDDDGRLQKRSRDNDDHLPSQKKSRGSDSKRHKKNTRQATGTDTTQRRSSMENHARPQTYSLLTCTSALAELTSTQSIVTSQLPYDSVVYQDAFVSSTSDPAVEGTCQEQLDQNASMQPPAVAPGPNDSTDSTSFPACSQDSITPSSKNTDDDLGIMDGYQNRQDDRNNAVPYNPTSSPDWPDGWIEAFQQFQEPDYNPFDELPPFDPLADFFSCFPVEPLFQDGPETV